MEQIMITKQYDGSWTWIFDVDDSRKKLGRGFTTPDAAYMAAMAYATEHFKWPKTTLQDERKR